MTKIKWTFLEEDNPKSGMRTNKLQAWLLTYALLKAVFVSGLEISVGTKLDSQIGLRKNPERPIRLVLKALHWLSIPFLAKYKLLIITCRGKPGLNQAIWECFLLSETCTLTVIISRGLCMCWSISDGDCDWVFCVAALALCSRLPAEMNDVTSQFDFCFCFSLSP